MSLAFVRTVCVWLFHGGLLLWSGFACAQDRQPEFFPTSISASSRLIFFEVSSQPLAEALITFALQGNLSVGLQEPSAAAVITPRVSGLYTTADGLRRLLAGSGLRYSFVDAQTVRVFRDLKPLPVRQAPAPQRTPRQNSQQDNRFTLEELIVTSTKRARDPQDIAVSVATVSAEQIEAMGVRDTGDLVSLVAGLSSTNQGPGRNKIFLRGQSDGPIAERTQSTVGIYIDESPLVYSDTNPDFRLVDVERIEVLRGPQGTLFGAGSLGGTFRIITNKPDPSEILGRVSMSGAFTNSGAPSYTVDGMINVPISSDRSALRLAAFYDTFGGFIDDVRLDEENINEATIMGGRLSYQTELGDRWSVMLTGNAQKISLDDTQYFSPDLGLLTRANYVPEPRKDQFYQGGLILEGDLGWAQFLAATTHVRRRIQNQSDASLAVPDLLDISLRPSPFTSRNKIATLAQEVRFSHEGQRFDWLIGGFYLDRNENLKTTFTVPGAGDIFAPLGFPTNIVFAEDRDDDVKQYAAFSDFSYRIRPTLEISLGLRWNRATLDVSSLTTGIVSARVEETDLQNRANSLTPRVSVSYEATPATTFYAQAAKGFRVGGVNINTPISALFNSELDPDEELQTMTFAEDKLWNYEIGFKSRLFDDRLSVDAAAFYVHWDDIQSDQILPTGFLFVTNAGNARNIGVEVQLAARFTENLTVTAVGIWNDPKLYEANAFLNAQKGDRLPAIAELTAGLAFYYRKPLSDRLTFNLSTDYSYVGSSRLFFDQDLSPRMGEFHRAGLRAGFGWESWEARLSVSNLFNNRGNTFAYGNSFSLNATSQFTPLRPRTFGFEISRAL
jgi:iron complex outermembrane recepter protein